MSCAPGGREHCLLGRWWFSRWLLSCSELVTGALMRLFVGDDWAEDHHDIEVMDEAGKVLARRRVAEGVAGMAQLHGLIGAHLGEDADDSDVTVGIETDRGPWVTALLAAG